jgi:hypothetical protein
MSKHITVEVTLLPCPCCGRGQLYAGVESAQSYGVSCPDCRLKMAVYMPGNWPKGVWKNDLSGDENLARLAAWTLNKAVEAWNKRTPKPAAKGRRHKATVSF